MNTLEMGKPYAFEIVFYKANSKITSSSARQLDIDIDFSFLNIFFSFPKIPASSCLWFLLTKTTKIAKPNKSRVVIGQ